MVPKTLDDILTPWLESLQNLPARLVKAQTTDVRGVGYWYASTNRVERWVLTVRSDHVEIRESFDSVTERSKWKRVIPFGTISAADPEFHDKVERGLRIIVKEVIDDEI